MKNPYRLDPDDAEFSFGETNTTRPWKKVALAIGLLVVGTVLLSVGLGLYLSGKQEQGGLPLIILGSITFIPGSYHTRIAYLAWKGRNGYSLNQIPDF
ncbi:hypothetical protein CHLRE_01g031600v5 [Chlamydomonas reinhardtii]|uniref:Transmembrane protein 230 n=1 Tax=Chlamydomonas reinhardtii TaxID=3055 RepID=A0A2K3E6T2_CHLRE|nr:uncharacterized protein CHLRE_01g031600v5 [Chlamydomonas reinhardtii]PNW88483.1 hypothetical protein CHLRE_01g031600v5 [Chlamydomonas reinhardtii]